MRAMKGLVSLICGLFAVRAAWAAASPSAERPDLSTVLSDLEVPAARALAPAPGVRSVVTTAGGEGSGDGSGATP